MSPSCGLTDATSKAGDGGAVWANTAAAMSAIKPPVSGIILRISLLVLK
jgi:hypothetical protein